MRKLVIWGTGKRAIKFLNSIDKNHNKIIAFIDNNQDKWGNSVDKIASIHSPNDLLNLDYDLLIVCSTYESDIFAQCRSLNIERFISSQNIANMIKENKGLLASEEIASFYTSEIEMISRNTKELLWKNYFMDTVSGYDWYNVKSLSLGRWAVGYNYMYVLARILDSFRPNSILEMGLGQSSKMLGSYTSNHQNVVRYDVVEQDENWIEFFLKDNASVREAMTIHHREIALAELKEGQYYYYKDFNSVVEGKKYGLISIDGPWGGAYLSRIDIIENVPKILEDDFVIILDDYERNGEKRMVDMLERQLEDNNIKFHRGIYEGAKDVYLCVSEKWKFLVTL